jgi:hypothetical protein
MHLPISLQPRSALVLKHSTDHVLTTSRSSQTPSLDRVDPSHSPTKSAIKLVGFLGVSAGFLMAYQRSSCECSI